MRVLSLEEMRWGWVGVVNLGAKRILSYRVLQTNTPPVAPKSSSYGGSFQEEYNNDLELSLLDLRI